MLVGGWALTAPFSERDWAPRPDHPDTLYVPGAAGEDVPVISPFHLAVDPMEGLLLINFEGDPDRVYLGFEPQLFDDEVHGRGLMVIGWRVDGRVDVFHEPGLRLNPETYGITGEGLHRMEERVFSPGEVRLGLSGVHVDLAFDDLEGRKVRLRIEESDQRPRTPFGLLAPMGSAASAPPALPLVYVDGFYFVRRAGTELEIVIDGRPHRSDAIPLMLDGAWVHAVRYATEPFIVTWNPDSQDRAHILSAAEQGPDGAWVAEAEGVRYDLVARGALREIRRMSRGRGRHEVAVEFSPPLPHLLALASGAEVDGEFRITAEPNLGSVRGRWQVARRGGEIHMEVVPDGGWTPGPAPRMANLLFRLVSMFRTWPTTYRWRAVMALPSDGSLSDGPVPLRGGWERTNE